MTTVPKTVISALEAAIEFAPTCTFDDADRLLSRLFCSAGKLCSHHHPNYADFRRDYAEGVLEAALDLATIEGRITAAGAAASARLEYERAHEKHNGSTPYDPSMSDRDRAVILMEEIGEVARCYTPDANTETGHAGNTIEELIQVAAVAAAWLGRIIEDSREEVPTEAGRAKIGDAPLIDNTLAEIVNIEARGADTTAIWHRVNSRDSLWFEYDPASYGNLALDHPGETLE